MKAIRSKLSRAWRAAGSVFLAVVTATIAAQSGDFIYTANGGAATITGYTGTGGAVVIPSDLGGNNVTRIGDSAFFDCTDVTSVTIPDSVTYVGNYAFDSCDGLVLVVIGDQVLYLGNYVFRGCDSLESVTIPDQVTYVGNYAFVSCGSLGDVTIGDRVTSLGSFAFDGCSSLTTITVGANNPAYSSANGVLFNKKQSILLNCPAGITGSYTVPDGVTSLGSDAFADCSGLDSVTIPASVTLVGGYAFAGCTGLNGVYFKGNVPANGASVFYNDTTTTVYYLADAKGWGAMFAGRPTAVWDAAAITVTFNAGGGTVTPASKSVTVGAVYGALPTPTRGGYTFAGWWTGANRTGTQVTAATLVTAPANHTLYAAWTEAPAKSDQTITFPALPEKTYGAADFAPGATASSGLAVTYACDNAAVATVVNGKIHLVGAGTGMITASQTGNGSWNPAVSVTQSLVVTAVVPTVTTTVPVVTGGATATTGGNVTSTGGAAVTARGVCWSTSPNPTVADAKTSNGAGAGSFTSALAGLSVGTAYYVRAYAVNSAGTAYGGPQSFTITLPDFVVTGIAISPALPAVGGKVTATVTVRNQGTQGGKAGSLYVWVDKPAPAVAGESGDKSASLGTLKAGQSKTVRLMLTAPNSLGAFTLRAFADARNLTTETNEPNNQATYGYDTGLPDFAIVSVSLSPAIPVAGKTFTAYVTVTNAGDVAGNGGSVDLWADSSVLPAPPMPGGTTKGNKYKTVGTLQPGQEKTITVTGLKTPANAAPTLGVLIDSRAKTLELNEGNNWFELDY